MTGKEKKKLGGAYPGNRRPQQAPYQPPQSEFQNGQATAHFVAYGGGNALVKVDQANSPPQLASGDPAKEYISGKFWCLFQNIIVYISMCVISPNSRSI